MIRDLAAGARSTLQEFVPKIDQVLAEIWNTEEKNFFGFNAKQKQLTGEMVVHAKGHNLAPSKRLRSAFVYQAYQLGGLPVSQGIWKAAAGVELVHTALLMHDDFMDEDILRRGSETTNAHFSKQFGKHYGDVMAVNIGDMVLSLGYETVVSCGLDSVRVVEAVKHLQRTIFKTAIGQAHDCTMEHWTDWAEDDVLAVHAAKTGLYTYENPLFVGAILAGLSEEIKHVLHEYAMDGGVAFQIQDDILGVFGDPSDTGKSADSDLLQGKRTLLALKTLEMGSESQKQDFLKIFGNREASIEEIQLGKAAISDSGALEYNRDRARALAMKAAKTAEKLREMSLNIEAIDFIQGVAEYMVIRKV